MGKVAAQFQNEAVAETFRDGSLDAPHLLQAIARHKRLIIGSTLAGLLLSVAYVMLVKPRYTGEATILVENQENYFNRADPSNNAGPAMPPDPEAVQTQVQLVQSRDVALAAIDKLSLVGNSEFDPLAGTSSALGRVEILLGLKSDPSKMTREDGILTNYYKRLSVLSPEKTRVVTLDFSSNSPELAARGANTIAQIYIDQQINAKRKAAQAASVGLASQIDTLKLRLAQAQANAEQYRLKAGLLVGSNNMTVSAQQLGDINTQLSAARAAKAEAEAKAELIRNLVRQGHISEIPDVANDALIRSVNTQRIALSAQLALESRTLLPGHPKIKELRAQLADLDAQLRSAAEKTARTLENQASLAALRVRNLETTLEEQKQVAGTANQDEVTLNKLDNDARLIKNELDEDVAKYQSATARQVSVSTPADARIVSRAIVPNQPSFPRKIPIVSASTLAGLIFSLAFVVARELLMAPSELEYDAEPAHPLPAQKAPASPEPTLGSSRKREDEPGTNLTAPDAPSAPLAAEIPSLATRKSTQAGEAAHAKAAGIANMAGKIEAAGHAGQGVVTLVTTPDMGTQARSQLASDAITLARELSKTQRTILVNLNSELVWVNDLVDETSGVGLTELLAGETSFAEVIHRDVSSRLHVLRFGNHDIDDNSGIDHVLDALCETYEQVVLVGPEYGVSDLDMTLAPFSDFALLATARRADDIAIVAIMRELERAGAGEVRVLSVQSTREPAISAA